jgi:hypothetical protein
MRKLSLQLLSVILSMACLSCALHAQETPAFRASDIKPVSDIVLSSQTGVSPNPALRTLKKKILVTGFTIPASRGLADMDPNIAVTLPKEIIFKLQATNKYLTKFSPGSLQPDEFLDAPDLKRLRDLAEFEDSQFIVTGQVLNASIETEKKFLGLWETRKRRFELEISVYDGFTGALLSHRKHTSVIDHDLDAERSRPFGSTAFSDTHFGDAINKLLVQVVTSISEDLDQQAFVARVVKSKGGEITLNAGSTSSLQPGDVLTAYQLQLETPVRYLTRPLEYGAHVNLAGNVIIRQVQEQFATASFSTSQGDGEIKVGDFLRFEPGKK